MTKRTIRMKDVLHAVLFLMQFVLTYNTICPTPQPYGTGVLPDIEQNKADQCFINPPCDPTNRYYSYNGSCNNELFPTWGQAPQAFLRYMPADYSDGVYKVRKSVNGCDLPSCRVITNALIKNGEVLDNEMNILWYGYGQFLDHDVSHQVPMSSSNALNKNAANVQCCVNGKPAPNMSEQVCCPIMVPKDDPFYSKFNITCLDLTRSINTQSIGCSVKPTFQMNFQTAYMDLSFSYGSDASTVAGLRLFKDGMLKTTNDAETSYQSSLPITSGRKNCPAGGVNQGVGAKCYNCGDKRCNQNIELVFINLLFVLNHNKIASILSNLNPHWNDEKIFQETRRILIALFQCITFKEYLGYLIGNDIMQKFNFTLASDGYKDGYDKFLNAGTLDIFSTACGRVLHTQIRGLIPYLNSRDQPMTYKLKDRYYNLGFLLKENMFLNMLKAQTSQTCQKQDTVLCDDVTDYLLRTTEMPYGMDLPSIDIQRGREWGERPYNDMRAAFGMDRFCSFDDLAPSLANQSDVGKFRTLYQSVDDIDAYTGCLAEKPIPGGLVGNTTAYCLAESFKRWVFGDRFYFEFPSANFTLAQLNSIRKACSMANLICSVYPQIGSVQKDAFRVPSSSNPLVPCPFIPQVNLDLWKEDPSVPQ